MVAVWLVADLALAFIQSSFVHLPMAELLSLCVPKEKVAKEKGHPGWRFPSIHGRKVREVGPGFSSGLLPARKGVAILGNARCAA